VFLGPLLSRTGVLAYLRRHWRDDDERAAGKVEGRLDKKLAALATRLDGATALERSIETLEREVRHLRTAALFNAQHRERRHEGGAAFDDALVGAQVANAIASAPLATDPMAHLVVHGLVPEPTYAALLDAIPPREFFSNKDPKKQNLRLSQADVVPEWTRTALGYMEDRLIPHMLVPALVGRFGPHMQAAYASSYGPDVGPHVASLPHVATAGRLMLRRPGYHLNPHLDPRRVIVTCLLYFARPGDSPTFGTTFFRIDGHTAIDQRSTYYPEEHGLRCEHVTTAPFLPNTAVAFLNAGGAHGADIPKDAPPHTERYSYQFYISPEPSALAALLGEPETPE
jgi:hypothetical protein